MYKKMSEETFVKLGEKIDKHIYKEIITHMCHGMDKETRKKMVCKIDDHIGDQEYEQMRVEIYKHMFAQILTQIQKQMREEMHEQGMNYRSSQGKIKMRKYDTNTELSKTAAKDLGYLASTNFITAYKRKDKIYINFTLGKPDEIHELYNRVTNSNKYTASPGLIKITG